MEKIIKLLQSIPKLSELNSPPVDWIWPDLLARNAVHLISGEPGAMKSMLAFYLALGVAQGNVFGQQRDPMPVIYIDRENPMGVVKQRFESFNTLDKNFTYWGMWHDLMPPFLVDDYYPQMVEYYVKTLGTPPLIVFDSFIRFHASDENDSGEMSIVTAAFRKLQALGATVIVLHHKGKPKDQGITAPYRGSSEISGACDIGFSMSKVKAKLGTELELIQFKNRFKEEDSLKLTFLTDETGSHIVPKIVGPTKEERDILWVMIQFPGLTYVELAEKTTIGVNRCRELLTKQNGILWDMRVLAHNKQVYFPKKV